MGSLEFLSGFNIGRVLRIAIDKAIDLENALGKDYDRYNSQWNDYFNDKEFYKGIKIGMENDELPKLSDNLENWFVQLANIMIN